MGQSFNSKILTPGKVGQMWEQRRGKLHFCLGLSLGCGRGIHFQGGGRKYQMHCSSTGYISLVSNKGSS